MTELRETIKLCDGFKLVKTRPLEYFETDDWQEIRKKLHLNVESAEWDMLTRVMFFSGHADFTMKENGIPRHIYIEVIPVKEVN